MSVHDVTAIVPARQGAESLALLASAIERGVPVEAIERLVQLHREEQDRSAAREFARARAAFQAECPTIAKSSSAKIVTKSGVSFSYAYAELDEIAGTVRPFLHKHGFSYSWSVVLDGGTMNCTCTLSHAAGHSASSTFPAPTDAGSAMSGPQRNAAALTYAKRQALLMVLGISTGEPDDDALAGSTAAITSEQAATLEALMQEVGANRAKFLAYLGVTALDELRASDVPRAVNALEAKRKKA